MLDLLETPAPYVTSTERRCSRCSQLKPLGEFAIKNKKTGLRRVWCRDCARAYGREHYRKNKLTYLAKNARRRRIERPAVRERLYEFLRQHPCVDCGESDIVLLDFDHRDRSMKRITVSKLIRSSTWASAEREIEKCGPQNNWNGGKHREGVRSIGRPSLHWALSSHALRRRVDQW